VIVRLVSSKTTVVLDVEDVSQVIVMGEGRLPVSASHETPSGIVVTSHAGEKDFPAVLRGLGMTAAPLEKA
jgi:hypothetical protein